mmetsp:Transcript_72125/g.156563  ORF Transcript_72125/g.156563 Transcript_72125/m.156563 type:complete len:251 (-) Transcript_72125:134-886(-)
MFARQGLMVVAYDAQIVSCNNGRPITYEVRVCLPFRAQWVVTRRYTDFERLRRALGSRSLQCELPPKALLLWLRPRLRDRRHEALARFLAEVMSSFPYQENDELARFLGVSIPQPSGLDVVNDELEVLIERSTERLPRRPGRSNLLEVAAQEAAWSAQIEQWMERLARRRRRRYLALLEVAAPEAAWSAELQAQMQLEQPCCTVCLEDFQEKKPIRHLPCGHAFHTSCVDVWLQCKAHCPVCRRGLRLLS